MAKPDSRGLDPAMTGHQTQVRAALDARVDPRVKPGDGHDG
jgi:hypothetical protein